MCNTRVRAHTLSCLPPSTTLLVHGPVSAPFSLTASLGTRACPMGPSAWQHKMSAPTPLSLTADLGTRVCPKSFPSHRPWVPAGFADLPLRRTWVPWAALRHTMVLAMHVFVIRKKSVLRAYSQRLSLTADVGTHGCPKPGQLGSSCTREILRATRGLQRPLLTADLGTHGCPKTTQPAAAS